MTKDYECAYNNPISVKKGELLIMYQEDTQWLGWVWCESQEMIKGWVPKNIIVTQGTNHFALKDYDATELTSKVGERLEIIDFESGWCLCKNSQGKIGWIPEENIAICK